MQIFEVTKKPVNEGILSNIGAIGKAVGSAAKSAMAQNLEKTTGVSFEPEKNPYGAKRSESNAASKPLVQQQAKRQQALWDQAVASMQKAQGVASPSQLTPASKTELENSLLNQVHKTLLQNKLGANYHRLPEYVDAGSEQEAKDIVSRIEASVQSLTDFSPDKQPGGSAAEWNTLAQAAYDAMSLMQFNPKIFGSVAGRSQQLSPDQLRKVQVTQDPNGQFSIGGQKLDPKDPAAAKIIQMIQTQAAGT